MTMYTAPPGNRAAGMARLETFAAGAGRHYARMRNFDFGPECRGNVSLLSPYVRHRLLLESEILAHVLDRHTLAAAGKFVDEIFWRAYFKGWLELRPSVWHDYRSGVAAQLAAIGQDDARRARCEAATTGATGIDCFDAWAAELVRTGYLHNHARMWFASIWVFTLGLPWQLGADFFLRHLVDGDPASNTLSWRWVCGLHTKGKTYLARVSNITSYTDGRFDPQGQLAISAPPLTETRVHPLPAAGRVPERGRIGLLITEEDCFVESMFGALEPHTLLGLVATARRSPLPVGIPATEFAQAAVADALRRAGEFYGIEGRLVAGDDWGKLIADWATAHDLDTVVTAYAPVGPVAELLAGAAKALKRRGVCLLQIRRRYDEISWPHANRGYFKFKKKVPALLGALEIVTDQRGRRREAS